MKQENFMDLTTPTNLKKHILQEDESTWFSSYPPISTVGGCGTMSSTSLL